MPIEPSPGQAISEFAPVDLRSFPAGRPPLLDLYQLVQGQYVLYCEAHLVFTEDARRRLLEYDVSELYVRITAGKVAAGELHLPDLLDLPDDQLPPLVKVGLLYNSAISTTRQVFTAPSAPESLAAAHQLVGTTVVHLTRNPGTFVALVQMMRHDFSIYVHSVNVCTYATALGVKLGLGREDLLDLSLAGVLHDVGKARIPKAILDKPGPLTEEEWVTVRRHPEWGVQLIGTEALKRPVVRIVILQHHERLGGSGYPQGLEGLEIHKLARLVALVDVYDALTGERPYRAPLSPFEALRTIRDDMAGQFDRDPFAAFVRMLGHEDG